MSISKRTKQEINLPLKNKDLENCFSASFPRPYGRTILTLQNTKANKNKNLKRWSKTEQQKWERRNRRKLNNNNGNNSNRKALLLLKLQGFEYPKFSMDFLLPKMKVKFVMQNALQFLGKILSLKKSVFCIAWCFILWIVGLLSLFEFENLLNCSKFLLLCCF